MRKAHYYADHEASKEKVRKQARKHRASNPQSERDRRRRYDAKNFERVREMKTAWKKANPDRVLDHDQVRRAREHGTQVEPISRKVVFLRDGGICHICRDPVEFKKMHLDHIIPLSKGGTHTYDNVAPSHGPCNLRKGATLREHIA